MRHVAGPLTQQRTNLNFRSYTFTLSSEYNSESLSQIILKHKRPPACKSLVCLFKSNKLGSYLQPAHSQHNLNINGPSLLIIILREAGQVL